VTIDVNVDGDDPAAPITVEGVDGSLGPTDVVDCESGEPVVGLIELSSVLVA
jgi:hypothetical protein